MSLITKAPRGTLDKLPNEIHKYQTVETSARQIAEVYGFKEIRTPVFEHTELFKRSVGDTTDIVQKEMYTFDDKKGRSLTLKPEGTAGAARSAIENGLFNDALPLKLYYFTNCYRYEAPQSGRYREFSQFGVEVFGADKPACDVQLLALASDLFKKLGISKYTLEINSIGCPECRKTYQDALKKYYSQFKQTLCGDCHERLERNPMRLLDCKNPNCSEYKTAAPLILEYNCETCADYFNNVKQYLTALEISYIVNPKIVRGLDYYTNTVFEFISPTGLVFGGGGRYNGLIEELGGNPMTGAGFALGIERVISVMEGENAQFNEPNTPDIYIAGLGEEAMLFALQLSHKLCKNGVSAQTDLTGRSVKAQMRYADKIGAKFSMVIGDNELQTGKAMLKNMITKEAEEIDINNFDYKR
ncbi:MAG: histidine--tRNA ligase [Oscillospiraceae bacterium]|nr:histidine--tRNA ligase [Oscillospiraceae bacterium]